MHRSCLHRRGERAGRGASVTGNDQSRYNRKAGFILRLQVDGAYRPCFLCNNRVHPPSLFGDVTLKRPEGRAPDTQSVAVVLFGTPSAELEIRAIRNRLTSRGVGPTRSFGCGSVAVRWTARQGFLYGCNNLLITQALSLLILGGNDFSEICEIPFPVRFSYP